MSFRENDYCQISMDDSFNQLSERNQKIVLNSWAKTFSDIVFPAINEKRFSVLYSENEASRPNTPANVVVGALIIKEMLGVSDDEFLEAICCDVRYQYALHTTSYHDQPVSDRTFSRFRERVYAYEKEMGQDLLLDEMRALSEVFSDHLRLNRNIKRMDSLMDASRCKAMSRLEIIYVVCANAVRLINRLGEDALLTPELRRYLDEEDRNSVIYHCKGDDVSKKLEREIANAKTLRQLMSDDAWREFEEYRMLERVIKEQAENEEAEDVQLKKASEIRSDSLQNPSDPDATYRKKAGQDHKGYVANIVETTGENGSGLITDVSFEENIHADTEFTREYLEKRTESDAAETVIVDGAYSSVELQEAALSKNVTLVPTALTGKAPDPVLADFAFSDDGTTIDSCPAGHAPLRCSYYEKTHSCRAVFGKTHCGNCPNREKCGARKQKKGYAVTISAKTVARAKQCREMKSEDYKTLSRKRNGVEGVMSVLRRKYHVDDIPVFGKLRTRMFFIFKICAYNVTRLHRHLKGVPVGRCAQLAMNGPGIYRVSSVFCLLFAFQGFKDLTRQIIPCL